MSSSDEPQMSMTFYLAQLNENFKELRSDIGTIKNKMLTIEVFQDYKNDTKYQLDEMKKVQREHGTKLNEVEDNVRSNSDFRNSTSGIIKWLASMMGILIFSFVGFLIQFEFSLHATNTYIPPSHVNITQKN